jgi:thiol-disulfide isomerase/thioredoxin
LLLVSCGAGSSSTGYHATAWRGGDRVSVSSLRGQPAVLTSWATWCRECKKLLPALERLHTTRGDELHVVAVNVNAGGDAGEIDAIVKKYGMTMPLWRDPDNDFTATFHAVGVPTTVLLDSGGKVLRTWAGLEGFDDRDVASAIDAAVQDR